MKFIKIWGVREAGNQLIHASDSEYFVNVNTITRITLRAAQHGQNGIVGMTDGSRIIVRAKDSIRCLENFLRSCDLW